MTAPTVPTSAATRPAGAELLDHVPHQRSAPLERPALVGRIAAGLATVAIAGTVVGVGQQAAQGAQRRAAQTRVDRAEQAGAADLAAQAGVQTRTAAATAADARAGLVGTATAAVADATAVAAASPHAGDALTGLTSASDAVTGTVGSAAFAPAVLTAQLGALVGARAGVVSAEAAWQAAQAAQAAAAQVAASAAAAAAARSTTIAAPRSSGGTVRQAAPRPSGGTVSGSASTSSGGSSSATSGGAVHAVVLSCTSASGSGTVASAVAVGAAINAYRASNGLPALSVSQSGGLTGHALDMAASGGIWHSGQDNIVGCAPGVGALVAAWSRSPAHNAQMLRTDVGSMAVGAATANGYLFAAVKFS